MRQYDWDKGRVCSKEGKGVSVVKREERRDMWVHTRIIEKRDTLDSWSHLK